VFLTNAATLVAGLLPAAVTTASATRGTAHAPMPARVRFGVVTDSHYADAASGGPGGTRYYRESLAKTREAVERLRAARADFLVHLGDIKDMVEGEPESRTLSYLAAIESEVQRFGGPTYHVLGNHDLDNISKAQAAGVLRNSGIEKGRTFYAFVHGGVRFVVLDACFTRDGKPYDHGRFEWQDTWVPDAQMDWLDRELTASKEAVIVLAHQRLDGAGDIFVRNAADVRAILERSRKVAAVLTGHDHPGGYNRIGDIHYYTQRAMVEGSGPGNNAYTLVEVDARGSLTITGYRRAVGMSLQPV
jgi:3',5'-cyclic AMP phosphodiesterase CpdA